MKLVCPICNSKYALEDACREQTLRDIADLAAFFGGNWNLVNEYIDCFKTNRCGSVTLKKQKRLLEELKSFFEKKEFGHDGRRYRVTQPQLIEGLKIVANNEKHGFQNHNYLKTVLINNQAERISAEGLTAAEEQKREEKRRDGSSRLSIGAGFKPAQPMTAAEYKKQKGIQSLADRICKNVL